jgi:hypothetical protein
MIKSIPYKSTIKFLLGMVIVGSILGIENSQAWGCVYGLEMLSIGNLIFLTISTLLLFKAFKSDSHRTVLLLVIIETAIWIIKYIFYKGGYVTGFGGTPNEINVLYDFIAIGTRIFLFLDIATHIRQKLLLAILLSIFIVALKINLFALPWFTQKMWEVDARNSSAQRIELIGSYNGSIYQFSDSLTAQISLVIDTTHLMIQDKPAFDLKEKYFFEIYSPNYGEISNDIQGYSMKIDKFDTDSLVFYLEDMYIKQYLVKMKTER